MSASSLEIISLMQVRIVYGVLSSVKFVKKSSSTMKKLSLMYTLNKKGPRMEPCGTPDETSLQSLNLLFTLVTKYKG